MVELGLPICAASCHFIEVCQQAHLCDSNPAALWSISAPPTLGAPWNALTIRSFVLLLFQHLQENLSQFSPLLLIWSPSRLPLQSHWASLWRQVVFLCVRSLLDAPSHHALCPCQGFVPVHAPFNSENWLSPLLSLLSRCVEAPYAKHTDRAQTEMCKITFLPFHPESWYSLGDGLRRLEQKHLRRGAVSPYSLHNHSLHQPPFE